MNPSNRTLARALALLAATGLVVAGCSDPAADVTAAKIEPAAPEPEVDETAAAAEAEAEAEPGGPAGGMPAPHVIAAKPSALFDGENSKIGFFGSKFSGSGHDGGFKEFEGTARLHYETGALELLAAEIDMTSLWSDNDKLTGHLKNADFFDVETYPEASFTSVAIEPIEGEAAAGGEGEPAPTHEISGNLKMHGETKQITFPATVSVTDEAIRVDAEFKIDRTQWGIVYGSGEGLLDQAKDNAIRDDVVIRLDIDAPLLADAEADAESTP